MFLLVICSSLVGLALGYTMMNQSKKRNGSMVGLLALLFATAVVSMAFFPSVDTNMSVIFVATGHFIGHYSTEE
jgi:dolichol kinase